MSVGFWLSSESLPAKIALIVVGVASIFGLALAMGDGVLNRQAVLALVVIAVVAAVVAVAAIRRRAP